MAILIKLTEPEIEAANLWHGGQYSMLYAVASTGALSRGTQRPYVHGRSLTDEEWDQRLASRLAAEAEEAAGLARLERSEPGRLPVALRPARAYSLLSRRLTREARLLESIARKARRFLGRKG